MSLPYKLLAGGLAGLVMLGGIGAAEAATATAAVNVRSGPGTGYSVLDTLTPGEYVSVRGCSGGWCYITHPGPDGWVSANYIGGSAPYPIYTYEQAPDYYVPPPVYVNPGLPHHNFHHHGNWQGKPPAGKPSTPPSGGKPWTPPSHPQGSHPTSSHPNSGHPNFTHPNSSGRTRGNPCTINPKLCIPSGQTGGHTPPHNNNH